MTKNRYFGQKTRIFVKIDIFFKNSFIDCQVICSMMVDCEFWTWRDWTRECFIKGLTGWDMRRSDTDTSGDKTGAILWPLYELHGGDVNC